jgi:uncharacterized membrane protein (UPF0127 family)
MPRRLVAPAVLASALPLLLGWGLGSCDRGDTSPSAARAVGPPVVILQPESGPELRIRVEIRRTIEGRRRGLMGRESLPADHGMLFIFDNEAIQSFWMKNTLIPLDMLFIAESMEVVGIVHDAEPRTTVNRIVDRPSRYVLEVNGGVCAKHAITPGGRVRFSGFAP